MTNIRLSAIAIATLSATLVGCGGDSDNSNNNGSSYTLPSAPTTYSFTNADGYDTVSYTGQVARHILIEELKAELADASTKAELDKYYRTSTDDFGDDNFVHFSVEDAEQSTYNDISSDKKLESKTAGQDKPEHLLDNELLGWGSITGPVDLVDLFFNGVVTEAARTFTINDGAITIDSSFVSPEGLDYQQLTQKFLLGAVAFNQGTADYLQTDFSSAENLTVIDGKSYTAAEHKWDEAFGYFGAARNYNDLTDEQIKAVFNDSDGGGTIDLTSEYNFGHSQNCAKRDAGATVPTDFTKETFDAFLLGRAIIDEAVRANELTAAAADELENQINIASVTWEKCIAATVVHYINDVIADMNDFNGSDFADDDNFLDLAKHWGEMKGFALSLQFSPASPFRADAASPQKLKDLYSLMGDAPVLADGSQAGSAFQGGATQYKADLEEARDILEEMYGFDEQNVVNW